MVCFRRTRRIKAVVQPSSVTALNSRKYENKRVIAGSLIEMTTFLFSILLQPY